jgi:hypothetical protein
MRQLCFSAVLVGLLCSGVLTPSVHGQVSQYGFIPNCPEGCRDIDKVTSCGSVAAAASCSMAINGDVVLSCADGTTYSLTTAGCGNGQGSIVPAMTPVPFPDSGGSTSGTGFTTAGFSAYIQVHTAGAETKIVDLLNQDKLARSIVLLCLAFLLGLVGMGLKFVFIFVQCALFGFTFLFLALAFFAAGEGWNEFIPLACGISGGVLFIIFGFVSIRVVALIVGSSFGATAAIMTLAIIAEVNPSLDIGATTPFFLFLGAILLFGMVGPCFPYLGAVLTLAVESALFVAFGAMELWQHVSALQSATGLGIMGASFALFLLVQGWFAIRWRNENRKKALAARIARGGYDEDYLRQVRNESMPVIRTSRPPSPGNRYGGIDGDLLSAN